MRSARSSVDATFSTGQAAFERAGCQQVRARASFGCLSRGFGSPSREEAAVVPEASR